MDFPYVSTDIREVEKAGNDLISKAYSNEPNNQLAEILYLADNGSKRKYMEALKKCKRKKLKQNLKSLARLMKL